MTLKAKIFATGLCLSVVILAYSNTLNSSFHWDDYHTIVKNPSIRTFKGALFTFIDPSGFSFYRTTMIRPFTMLSYYFNYSTGGLNPLGWHIFNLCIHFLNSILIILLTMELFSKFPLSHNQHLQISSLCCGLFFAVHPMQTEAVNYLSARSMLLMTTFYLSSLILYFRGKNSFSWLLFICALLTREDALTLPFTLLFIEGLSALSGMGKSENSKTRLKAILQQTSPYIVILGAYLIYRKVVLGELASSYVRGLKETFILQVWSLGVYQKIIATMSGMSISHYTKEREIVTSLFWWVSLFVIFSEMLVAFICAWNEKLVSLGIGWFFLALSLSMIAPLNWLAFEHRVYLAMFGPCLLGAILCSYALQKTGGHALGMTIKTAVICLVIALAMSTRERNKDWIDEAHLWRSAVEAYPFNPTAWNRYGLALKDFGDYDGAINAYKKSLAIEPSSEVFNNLSVACGLKGDKTCAWESIRKSLELAAENPNALFNFANMLFSEGKIAEAINAYKKAVKARDVFPEAHRNLAIALLAESQTENKREALEHLKKSLQQDPYQADAQKLWEAIKQLAESIKDEGGG